MQVTNFNISFEVQENPLQSALINFGGIIRTGGTMPDNLDQLRSNKTRNGKFDLILSPRLFIYRSRCAKSNVDGSKCDL